MYLVKSVLHELIPGRAQSTSACLIFFLDKVIHDFYYAHKT